MKILGLSPVIPVVVINELDTAVPLAQALLDGGVKIIEITLRSPIALDAVSAVAAAVPDMHVGAGSILTPKQMKAAAAAGAQFLVTPGSTDRLLDALQDTGLPFLAGCATPSDMLRLVERGLTDAKFFPASAAGGLGVLRAVRGPLPQLRFCPTGGISAANAADYLALPNVPAVGGSWLAPEAALAARDWATVTKLASSTIGLATPTAS